MGRVLSHASRLPALSFPRRQSHVIPQTTGKSRPVRKILVIIGMMIVSALGESTPRLSYSGPVNPACRRKPEDHEGGEHPDERFAQRQAYADHLRVMPCG